MIYMDDIIYNDDRLAKLNTLTKYPSILTYHALGKRGGMTSELCNGESFKDDDDLYITEKVDGTNTRLIMLADSFLIGSRENIVYAKDDKIINSEIVKPTLEALREYEASNAFNPNDKKMVVIYGETYGHKIATGKQYTTPEDKSRNFRVFDVMSIDYEFVQDLMSDETIDSIANWRDHMQQPFLDRNIVKREFDAQGIDTVPDRMVIKGKDMPKDVEETYAWLQQFSHSLSTISPTPEDLEHNKKFGQAEGVVIRNADRSMIRKLRFEDYEKGKRNDWK